MIKLIKKIINRRKNSNIIARSIYDHAEGYSDSTVYGYSHAEGNGNYVYGYPHAEGNSKK